MRLRALAYATAAVLAVASAGALWVADRLTRPEPRAAGAPPAQLGAIPVTVPVPGSSSAKGWWAPGEPGRGTVVLLHPIHANRESMMGRALFLRSRGYATLALDLPGHGESEAVRIGFGVLESRAAKAAIEYARERAPDEPVGAIGVSLGGAAMLLGDEPLSLQACVLESVYPDIGRAVANRLRLRLGAPGAALAPLLTVQIPLWLGIGTTALSPVARIAALRSPLLLVHGEEDRHTTAAEARELFAAAREPKSLWIVAGAAHEDLHAFAREEYEQRIGRFFEQWMRPPPER